MSLDEVILEKVWKSIQTPESIETNPFGTVAFIAGLIKEDRYLDSRTWVLGGSERFQDYLDPKKLKEEKQSCGILVRKAFGADMDAAIYFKYPAGEEYIFKRKKRNGKMIAQRYDEKEHGKWRFYEI